MENNKLSFIKNRVLSNGNRVQVITDKAIMKVATTFNRYLSMRDTEELNKSLVIPIHRETANKIIYASREFDDMMIDKVFLIAS